MASSVKKPLVAQHGFIVRDDVDPTKQVEFDVSGVSTGTTRQFKVPNKDINIADNPTTTLGDIAYASTTATPAELARLAGNTTTTKQYLSQTGDGANSAAPSWSQPSISELVAIAALSIVGNATNGVAAPSAIEAATDHHVLRRSGTTLGFGLLTNNNIDAAAAIAGSKISPAFGDQNITVGDGFGVDTNAAGALNIGTTNATTVNIGKAGATVNIYGDLNYIHSTDLQVEDKLITLNKGGATESAGGAGIEIEENSTITGSIKIGPARDTWVFEFPNVSGSVSLKGSASDFDTMLLSTATADRVVSIPDATCTLAGLSVAQTWTAAQAFTGQIKSLRDGSGLGGIIGHTSGDSPLFLVGFNNTDSAFKIGTTTTWPIQLLINSVNVGGIGTNYAWSIGTAAILGAGTEHNLFGHLTLGSNSVSPNTTNFNIIGSKKSSLLLTTGGANNYTEILNGDYTPNGVNYYKTTTGRSGARLLLSEATAGTQAALALYISSIAGNAGDATSYLQPFTITQYGGIQSIVEAGLNLLLAKSTGASIEMWKDATGTAGKIQIINDNGVFKILNNSGTSLFTISQDGSSTNLLSNIDGLSVCVFDNASSGTSAAANFRVTTNGGGDAYILMYAGAYWSVGIDNSDSDAFCIASSTDLSSREFQIKQGVVTLGYQSGSFATSHIFNVTSGNSSATTNTVSLGAFTIDGTLIRHSVIVNGTELSSIGARYSSGRTATAGYLSLREEGGTIHYLWMRAGNLHKSSTIADIGSTGGTIIG